MKDIPYWLNLGLQIIRVHIKQSGNFLNTPKVKFITQNKIPHTG